MHYKQKNVSAGIPECYYLYESGHKPFLTPNVNGEINNIQMYLSLSTKFRTAVNENWSRSILPMRQTLSRKTFLYCLRFSRI